MDTATGPAWDDAVAETLVGKRVHLELTYTNGWGMVVRSVQFCGRVMAANRHAGIYLALDDGETGEDAFRLPPDLSTFEWAYPGEYRDDVTGDLVLDPEVRATWNITAPDRPPASFWNRFGRRAGERLATA